MIFIRLDTSLNIQKIEENSDHDYSDLIGKDFFSLFANQARKEKNKVYRWLNDPTTRLDFTGVIKLTDKPYEYAITCCLLKNEIALTLENLSLNIDVSNSINFSSRFWPIFSQTFEGGFLFLDKDNKILEISQAAIDMLELKNSKQVSVSRSSILQQSLNNYFNTPEGMKFYGLITFLQNESLNEGVQKKHERYHYGCHYLNISLGPVYKHGQLLGYCVYLFDVTSIVNRDEQIKSQEALLIHSSKMAALGEMAGGIAHEINNPLTVIGANLALMKKLYQANRMKPEDFEKITSTMNRTLDRISKIIKGLRVISRDASQENFHTVRLKDITEDVLGLCHEKFKMANIQLSLRSEEDVLDSSISCRAVQISQVLLNLLNNAFDAIHNEKEKWVEINLSSRPSALKIEVIDSGHGIPENIKEKIFQPFFTTKDIGKGTGLGLSLSYSIINDHKGKFYIDNQNPHTAFVIELPH